MFNKACLKCTPDLSGLCTPDSFCNSEFLKKKRACDFLKQLIILLEKKNHIHVHKRAKAKLDWEHFIKEIKYYGTTPHNITNRKSGKMIKRLELCHFNLVN